MNCKNIDFCDGYSIYDDGKVYSHKRNKYLKARNNGNGYFGLQLKTICGKWKTFYIHRLVAEFFVEGKCDNMEVNHKDGNKANNHHTNLEWLTHKQNMEYNITHLGYDNNTTGIKTFAYDNENDMLYEFKSMTECSRFIGIQDNTVSNRIKNLNERVNPDQWTFGFDADCIRNLPKIYLTINDIEYSCSFNILSTKKLVDKINYENNLKIQHSYFMMKIKGTNDKYYKYIQNIFIE